MSNEEDERYEFKDLPILPAKHFSLALTESERAVTGTGWPPFAGPNRTNLAAFKT
jgi:hypothetical protein